jgi:hypothetical protein
MDAASPEIGGVQEARRRRRHRRAVLTVLAAVALIVVLAFTASLSYWIVSTALSDDAALRETLAAGFAGAFFAYLFVRFADGRKAAEERRRRSRLALVKLEHALNDALFTISSNRQSIEEFVRFARPPEPGQPVAAFFVSFAKLPVLREHLLDLTNIDLVNELVSLAGHFELADSTLASAVEVHRFNMEKFGVTEEGRATYIACVQQTASDLRRADPYLKSYFDETKQAAARVRVLLRWSAPVSLPIWLPRGSKHYDAHFHAEAAAELKVLEGEIAEIESKSKSRIEELDPTR